MQYELSNEIEKIAGRLIKQYHPELASKNIRYVTQERKDKETGESQAQMRKGKPVLADVKVVGGLNAFLVSGEARTDSNGPTPFAVIVASKHAWNALNPKQREAMIDEQLCRLDYDDETGRPTVLDYDAKAFTLNVKRFGAWNHDLDTFLKASKEFPLFADLDDAPTKPSEPSAEQQAKILKGGNGSAKQEPREKVKKSGNGINDLKQEVAKRRGARAVK